MVPASSRLSPGRRRLPWLAAGLCAAGWSVLGLGCAQPPVVSGQPLAATRSVPATGAVTVPAPERATEGVVRASYNPEGVGQPIPINLDTVLRLAEEKNSRIELARERVNESLLESQLASRAWLPQVYAGVGYFRHEGGIQNEDGRKKGN